MIWYLNYFHVQILIIELLLCWRLPRCRNFWLRFVPAAAVYLALPFVVPGGFFAGFLTAGWFTFGFLLMLLFSAALLWFCFHLTAKQLVFSCCVAHTLQHAVHCLGRIFYLALATSRTVAQGVELLLFLLAVAVAVCFLLRKQFGKGEMADIKSTHLLVFAVLSSLTVYLFSYWTTTVEGETVGEQFFDLFSCVLLILILFDFFRFGKAEREQIVMKRLLRQEQEQHRLSKATIEVINRKCHDLRHQISALRTMPEEEQARSISELEDAILIYDGFAKSGNADLDIILAEKSLLAEKQGVSLRCIADGKKLSFLRTEDLYSLFGNAFDNAIEATSQEDAAERRIVELNISARGNILTVNLTNPCRKTPVFEDGLPLTTKTDTDYHGYGMRSMRYIAEKYRGALTTGWEDGIFFLSMIFPL